MAACLMTNDPQLMLKSQEVMGGKGSRRVVKVAFFTVKFQITIGLVFFFFYPSLTEFFGKGQSKEKNSDLLVSVFFFNELVQMHRSVSETEEENTCTACE